MPQRSTQTSTGTRVIDSSSAPSYPAVGFSMSSNTAINLRKPRARAPKSMAVGSLKSLFFTSEIPSSVMTVPKNTAPPAINRVRAAQPLWFGIVSMVTPVSIPNPAPSSAMIRPSSANMAAGMSYLVIDFIKWYPISLGKSFLVLKNMCFACTDRPLRS